MGKKSSVVDHYIDDAAPFAQPILLHLRHLVHQTCPDAVEAIKWGHIFFEYGTGNLCQMAAFKQHAVFGFWLESKMADPHKVLKRGKGKESHSNMGKLVKLSDLPSDKILKGYIKEAMSLIDQGVKISRPKKADGTSEAKLEIPDYLITALRDNKTAQSFFAQFSPSARKDYILWLTEAKTDATRNKRLATAIEWISEGKTRHWKYQK